MVNVSHNIIVNFKTNLKNFDTGLRIARKGLIQTRRDLYKLDKVFHKGAKIGLYAKQFQMYGLSIMFLGMQISRIFASMAKAATTTFTKIMESSGFLGSSIQQLNVHFEYLKFIVGSAINRALEPLMPVILRIIDAVTKWIQKHPELTTIIIAAGLAIGVFGQALGQMILSIGPLITLLTGPAGLTGLLIALSLVTIGTLGFASLVKVMRENEEVGKNLKEMFMTTFESVKSLITEIATLLIPSAESSMESFGYTTAWALNVWLYHMNANIDKVRYLVSLVQELANVWEYFVATMQGGDTDAISRQRAQIKSLQKELLNSILLDTGSGLRTLVEGPTAYMEEMKSRQNDNAVAVDYLDLIDQAATQQTGGTSSVSTNIENVYVESNDMASMLESIKLIVPSII